VGTTVTTAGTWVMHVGRTGEWASGQFQTGTQPITVELG
jgi:hypothetical protein